MGDSNTSKAKDTRKDVKRTPAKSLLEKRAAKREKKATRLFRSQSRYCADQQKAAEVVVVARPRYRGVPKNKVLIPDVISVCYDMA